MSQPSSNPASNDEEDASYYDDQGYHDGYWYGPGWYWGVYIDNEDDYWRYRGQHSNQGGKQKGQNPGNH